MKINFKKPYIGAASELDLDTTWTVQSISIVAVSWVSELRYLDVNIVNSTSLKFLLERVKQHFLPRKE